MEKWLLFQRIILCITVNKYPAYNKVCIMHAYMYKSRALICLNYMLCKLHVCILSLELEQSEQDHNYAVN